ncbi:transcription termination/antitermination factor NusG [candidate division NPL-UPA2 bacterium Unc8]|uniref:Transcription termination/antitermination protein NusG n=1 Tax=candidate division NPL-UPA2 bacterium Unc8 TaxID=1980939 RepID=A0A399FYN1_UNCN2|nr:Transcription termination/antitermination protein NusG [Bacillota bacterium]MBT9138861.1 Transcription termination/antitermination protein NusG [Bacillota bacterium]MBT9146489.1 Transcription termination/antitermination protein NusG [Bacillota bacterium]RII00313.1 MAG: transcription termination/antitermination factor NusG [candidate division NPL-UPA2 bacterium Unc8]
MSKWYAVCTLPGREEKVGLELQNRINSKSMQDVITNVFIPTEEVMEIRRGEKRIVKRNLFPGYILVKMKWSEEGRLLIKETSGTIKFAGSNNEPAPLEDDEVEKILQVVEKRREKPQSKSVFEKGERVKIIEGPFVSLEGIVGELNPEKGKLQVMISIFGRETPVELECWQVESI